MHIQWFPGHMHKARKEMQKILPQIDVIIEILDARIPFSSENPMIAEIRGEKPCIKVLNKCDLADPELTRSWQEYLESRKQTKTLATNMDEPDKIRQIPKLCHKLQPGKSAKAQTIKCLIMGIPNVGKSTLINTLAGKVIAKTGNEPAVTKMQQRIQIQDHILLFDTPGVLWPNVENRNSGYRLAMTGAIKDTVLAYDELAVIAAEFLLNHYPERVVQRYQLESPPESVMQLVDHIGKKRGCLVSGGRIDYDKTGKRLIQDIRSGMLGPVTFESPEIVKAELAELAIIKAEKAAKKAARLNKHKQRR